DPAGEAPLMTAAAAGSLDAVRLLLDRGAAVDAEDPEFRQTALMIAVRENHPPVVQLLVERHADVNAKTRTGNTPPWVLPNSIPGFGTVWASSVAGCPIAGRDISSREACLLSYMPRGTADSNRHGFSRRPGPTPTRPI